jgi:hypothetical protein
VPQRSLTNSSRHSVYSNSFGTIYAFQVLVECISFYCNIAHEIKAAGIEVDYMVMFSDLHFTSVNEGTMSDPADVFLCRI